MGGGGGWSSKISETRFRDKKMTQTVGPNRWPTFCVGFEATVPWGPALQPRDKVTRHVTNASDMSRDQFQCFPSLCIGLHFYPRSCGLTIANFG